MNQQAGVRFGPVLCRIEHMADCRPAARLVRERLRHMPQVVFLDMAGNVRISPGYTPIPDVALRWMIGSYNRDATVEHIAADIADELRSRLGLSRIAAEP